MTDPGSAADEASLVASDETAGYEAASAVLDGEALDETSPDSPGEAHNGSGDEPDLGLDDVDDDDDVDRTVIRPPEGA